MNVFVRVRVIMRKEHLYGIAVGFLAALATAHAADAQQPNILLILADDVGAKCWDVMVGLRIQRRTSIDLPQVECASDTRMRWQCATRRAFA